MTLRQKQSLFVRLIGQLIVQAHYLGYELTFGESYRSRAEARRLGFTDSNHGRRLAFDLNLFKNGRYLRASEAYRPLGDWWVYQNSLCRWGGDFTKPDGNHFSLFHRGVA